MNAKKFEEFLKEFIDTYKYPILKFNEKRMLLHYVDSVIVTRDGNISDLSMMPIYLWNKGYRDASKITFSSYVFFKIPESESLVLFAIDKCFGKDIANGSWRFDLSDEFDLDSWFNTISECDNKLDSFDPDWQVKEMGEYIEEHQDDIIGNYLDEEWYLGRNGNPLVIFVSHYGDVTRHDYKFSIRDLKKSNKFLTAMLTDGDVNHNLGIAGDEEYRRVVDWFNSTDDSMPISPCGMENFVDCYCENGELNG